MYCPNCGNTANQKLKYCNSCGERLSKAAEIDKEGTPGKMLDNILTTLFLVVMFGLGILVGLVAVLLGNGVEPKFVMFIAIAYLGAVFGICYTLLSQVPKLIDAKLKATASAVSHEPAAPLELRPVTTAQLGMPADVPASVTEHTTRTLDKVPLQRQ
jgi:hypothetical protein